MVPPPKNREIYVVEYPDGRTLTVPSKPIAFYRALYGPIGTIAYSVTKGHRTLIVKRTPDQDTPSS